MDIETISSWIGWLVCVGLLIFLPEHDAVNTQQLLSISLAKPEQSWQWRRKISLLQCIGTDTSQGWSPWMCGSPVQAPSRRAPWRWRRCRAGWRGSPRRSWGGAAAPTGRSWSCQRCPWWRGWWSRAGTATKWRRGRRGGAEIYIFLFSIYDLQLHTWKVGEMSLKDENPARLPNTRKLQSTWKDISGVNSTKRSTSMMYMVAR